MDQCLKSLHRLTGPEPVRLGVHAVVHKSVHGAGSHMHPGIAGSIVDEHLAVLVCYLAVGEQHVHHIAHIFFSFRNHEEACRLSYHS